MSCLPVAANQAPPMPKTTPLLEALKAEKSASKDKEAILRNHAHYKDPAILASTNALRGAHAAAVAASSSKDEAGKKKGGPSTQPREAASADVGKKGKKPHVTQTAVAKQQHVAAAAKKEHAPSPKPSRAARQQAAAARAAQTAAQPQVRVSAEAPPVSASSSGEGGGVAATTPVPPASVAANVGAAVAASRRGRPIVGLGSRHLQAALSQVGAAAIERKRREREKDVAAKEGTSANAVEASAEAGQGLELGIDDALPTSPEPPAGREISKPGSPSSPRRDRRRKDRVGHQHDGGGLKVPSIMQRPDGVPPPALQRDAPGQVLPSPARPQGTSTNNMGDNVVSGGHPPRGPRRGRGRGRGGPIHRGG
jgi:regulator of nonsense transcripts 3